MAHTIDPFNRATHQFDTIKVARTFTERLQGLLVFKEHPHQLVYLIPRCKIVHTFGMSYPIDIIFINRSLCIVHINEHVAANEICLSLEAAHTLELQAGAIREHNIKLGDRLCAEQFSDISN